MAGCFASRPPGPVSHGRGKPTQLAAWRGDKPARGGSHARADKPRGGGHARADKPRGGGRVQSEGRPRKEQKMRPDPGRDPFKQHGGGRVERERGGGKPDRGEGGGKHGNKPDRGGGGGNGHGKGGR